MRGVGGGEKEKEKKSFCVVMSSTSAVSAANRAMNYWGSVLQLHVCLDASYDKWCWNYDPIHPTLHDCVAKFRGVRLQSVCGSVRMARMMNVKRHQVITWTWSCNISFCCCGNWKLLSRQMNLGDEVYILKVNFKATLSFNSFNL